MELPPLTPGLFVKRVNRFRVTLRIDGVRVDAHLPNSGRLTELLTPGRLCWAEPAQSPRRKTDFDLRLVEYGGVLVSVDARLPNPLFAEALAGGRLEPFQTCQGFEREVKLGGSRIDFVLHMPAGSLWVETKSVTLVEGGIALFPDAPTARGARHAEELGRVTSQGGRAAVVFVIQRPDAGCFAPYDEADPEFGQSLRAAAHAGVGVYAWTCHVTRNRITIGESVPVHLG